MIANLMLPVVCALRVDLEADLWLYSTVQRLDFDTLYEYQCFLQPFSFKQYQFDWS